MAQLVSSSTALAFLTNISEKHKFTTPSAIQKENQWKTIGNEEKSDVISQREKDEQIVDVCRNVRLSYSSTRTICDNAEGIKDSAKCSNTFKYQQSEIGSVCLCSNTTTVLLEWTMPRTTDVILLHFYCIRN
jgi:hypothetical protein